jgi:hypothetical protein
MRFVVLVSGVWNIDEFGRDGIREVVFRFAMIEGDARFRRLARINNQNDQRTLVALPYFARPRGIDRQMDILPPHRFQSLFTDGFNRF